MFNSLTAIPASLIKLVMRKENSLDSCQPETWNKLFFLLQNIKCAIRCDPTQDHSDTQGETKSRPFTSHVFIKTERKHYGRKAGPICPVICYNYCFFSPMTAFSSLLLPLLDTDSLDNKYPVFRISPFFLQALLTDSTPS